LQQLDLLIRIAFALGICDPGDEVRLHGAERNPRDLQFVKSFYRSIEQFVLGGSEMENGGEHAFQCELAVSAQCE
jgi:hypothetical protein